MGGSLLLIIFVIPSSLLFHIKHTSMWAAEWFDIYPEIAGITLSTSRFPAFCSTVSITLIFHIQWLVVFTSNHTPICPHQIHKIAIWSMIIFPVSLICIHSPNKVMASSVKHRTTVLGKLEPKSSYWFKQYCLELYRQGKSLELCFRVIVKRFGVIPSLLSVISMNNNTEW